MVHSQAAATLENVLHRVRSVEESQSRSTAMLNKLRLEMVDVAGRVHELEFSHKLAMREINSLLQKFGEQMAISRRKEQEKARLAFLHLREEMEVERDACRLLKMQNKKLTKDLTHANMAAADACEELDRERKARELLEEVCNELAREIGEDKAEVEHLKQEQKECRERLEKELKMMRMAALWRDDRVRSKLSEAQLELMDNNGKQGMPLHELRSKLEDFVSAVGGTCKGSEEEIQKQAEQAKLLTQALELLELEECRRSQDDAENVSSAVRDSACPNTCFMEENASSSAENQLYGDEGNFSHGDTGTMNGKEHRLFVNEKKKPRKGRRRMRANGKQRHNGGIRIYDQKNYDLWSTHCRNSAWPSSEDEPDSRELISLQNRTPYWKGGHALEGDLHAHNLHANANSAVVNRNNELLASSGHGRHTVLKEMRPSVLDAASSGHISTKESCHLEQSLSNNSTGKESQRKHSSSARFEIRTGAGELGCTLEAKVGPSMQYSFSEDDAANYYIGNWDERREKEGKENVREDKHHVRHPHDHLHILKSTGRGEKNAEDSELDDFCFESLREPANAFNDKLSYKANKEENGVSTERLERGFSNCSDDACCGIMANCSQSCKDRKNKLHENAESITILATQELSNVEGSADVGGKETINKMSPWRSASTKPRPCFWPPSPDAFSIFGGAKKRSQAYSPTPVTSIDGEYHMNRNSGSHPHDARRHTSPAREAYHQQHLVCVKSNSLGAQLIKARELETEKPAKPSFRFSPLRRATSHG